MMCPSLQNLLYILTMKMVQMYKFYQLPLHKVEVHSLHIIHMRNVVLQSMMINNLQMDQHRLQKKHNHPTPQQKMSVVLLLQLGVMQKWKNLLHLLEVPMVHLQKEVGHHHQQEVHQLPQQVVHLLPQQEVHQPRQIKTGADLLPQQEVDL